jgi:hypothetical protein
MSKLYGVYREIDGAIMIQGESYMVDRMANEVHVISHGSKLESTRGERDSDLLPGLNNSFLSAEDEQFIENVVNRQTNWISAEDMYAYEKQLWETFAFHSLKAELDKTNCAAAETAYKTGQRFLQLLLYLHDGLGYYYIHSIGRQVYWQALAMQSRNCELLGWYEPAKQFLCRLLYRLIEDSLELHLQPYQDLELINITPIVGCVVSLARIERRMRKYENGMKILALLSDLHPLIVDEEQLSEQVKPGVNSKTVAFNVLNEELPSIIAEHANPHWWDEHYVTPDFEDLPDDPE